MGVALSSLVVGERIISRCDDGLLLAEYGLFDSSEVMVSGNAVHGVREQGYFTTAERARGRLEAGGITPEVIQDTFRALGPALMRALARSPSVLLAVDRLGPYEAFEGGVFRASSRTYQGAWLDLEALVAACSLPSAAELFQAMHLRQVLDEVADDVPVRLLTANATRAMRAGGRTGHSIAFTAAPELPRILRGLGMPPRKKAFDDADEVREELLRNLRARSAVAKLAEPRIRSLATIVARTGKTPAPMVSVQSVRAVVPPTTTQPAIDLRALGDVPLAEADPLELFDQLRGPTQLLRGDDRLRSVALHLSSMADGAASQPELGVLAARAWLAAGDPARARHFARRVAEDVAATDAVRLLALEILDTATGGESRPPPPVAGEPIVPMPILLASPHHQFAPSGASLPPLERVPYRRNVTIPAMPRAAPLPTFDSVPQSPPASPGPPPPPSEPPAPRPDVIDVPPEVTSVAMPTSAPSVAPPAYVRPEIVESLALPQGLTEEMLAEDAQPTTPGEARLAMTRLARMLGRDYRLWYGTTLMTSVIAIEAMQRHLRRRFDEKAVASGDVERVEAELVRHGALLSEILARSLGAQWVDLPSDKPGHWAMTLYPDIRVWPIGRIYRFFQRGHREADLVAFYLDLETQVRRTE